MFKRSGETVSDSRCYKPFYAYVLTEQRHNHACSTAVSTCSSRSTAHAVAAPST